MKKTQKQFVRGAKYQVKGPAKGMRTLKYVGDMRISNNGSSATRILMFEFLRQPPKRTIPKRKR